MECDICLRRYDAQRLPFLCALDARNHLYPSRVAHAQRLIGNEQLQHDVRRVLDQPGSRHGLEVSLANQVMAQHHTHELLAAAQRLRQEIQTARDEIRARKAALASRRSDMASISQGLSDRRAKHQLQVQEETQMSRLCWSQSAHDMARTRAFLCHETLKLYGLEQLRKGPSARYEYVIGQIPVVDLTCMDALSPLVISTSLDHLAHVLLLLSHYLSIRLPAEITLPHRDYPRPTIFSLASSYQHHSLPSSLAPASDAPSSPSPDLETGHVPRPRPLFIDKPLQQLAKEDTANYSLFLEGVTLLAYDIAWLCCTQRVSIGDKASFDDVCHMGRNLHAFMHAAHMAATAQEAEPAQPDKPDEQAVGFGYPSHETTFYSLNNAQGTEFVRFFKLSSPIKLADRLRRRLAGDSTAADWEVLDHDEWKLENAPNQTDAVKTEPAPTHESSKMHANVPSKIASVNSWTKIKYRP